MIIIIIAMLFALVFFCSTHASYSNNRVRRIRTEPVIHSLPGETDFDVFNKLDVHKNAFNNFDYASVDLKVNEDEALQKPQKCVEGLLEDFGIAPYLHIPHNKLSFFARINGTNIWSVGIGDAIRNSTVKKGDFVVLKKLHETSVKFSRILGKNGEVIGTERLKTPKRRGFWSIELVGRHDQQHGIATPIATQPLTFTPSNVENWQNQFDSEQDFNSFNIQQQNNYDNYALFVDSSNYQ